MKRIICVGNRFIPADAAGPRVYDALVRRELPDGVQVVDGGLAGLDLLRFVEGVERVVFVDRVVGFGRPGEVVVLDAVEAAVAGGTRYDHAAGLTYLLRALPVVCEGALPDVLLVGIEGEPDEAAIAAAAALSLQVVIRGRRRDAPVATETDGGGA
ncbi:MAG: hydrogenase maturation protease [Chloroflexi bacterium]|nr:hydrogenase maturation protease [Chloroflexota bacterium]